MPKPRTRRNIDAATDDFLSELQSLIHLAAREAVQRALTGKVEFEGESSTKRPQTRAASQAKPASRPTGKRERRTRKEVEATIDQLLTYIEAHPGERMEQISAGLELASRDLTLPMRHLLRENHLRTEGQKRATVYFAR